MASDVDGTLSAVVYADNGGLPGTELFESQFGVSRLTWAFGVAAGWFGANNLQLVLDAGTYWLAFEVLPSDSLYGVLPNEGGVTMQATAPNPLAKYAVQVDYGSGWHELPEPFGMRISGQVSQVSEPATNVLVGLGLVWLAFSSRRKKICY